MTFDISKAIVVNDFETKVNGEVDFFDDKTYLIERKFMDVPINHSDGCGLVLPKINNKSFMIRLPWVKGLISPFAFDEFCKYHNHNGDIVDIYGEKYNIFKNEIEIILTKSQFKMWRYYNSWQEYIDCYKKYNCTCGYCNEEPDHIKSARLNYQMLQTLTDISDKELTQLAKKTNDKIENISSDLSTILSVLKADTVTENSTYLQQAIHMYPELLGDIYTKEKLKLLKSSLVRDARAGKLSVNAKYTFIIPDLYAFCENLFLGVDNPNGLLNNGEVSCSLFPESKELDCMRSPHLDNAHAIRKNILNDKNKQWLITKGLYTSCKDLISKVLMFDNDGDTSLVCADKLLIKIAKRNIKDDVPMYYHMAQAQADTIDSKRLFEGLRLAFTSGNIGNPSNEITKIWNSKSVDLELIKILCAETNYIIDYAKTLYKPKRPKQINQKLTAYSTKKVPYFFKFAKDKTSSQVEPINNSTVNRLYNIIKPGRLHFIFDDDSFDFRMLMQNPAIDINQYDKICKIYDLFKKSRYNLSANTQQAIDKREAVFRHRREQFIKYFKDVNIISDVLVKYLYGQNSKHKDVLWYCFGDVLVDNLKTNLERKYNCCFKCGKQFYAEYHNQMLCKKCSTYNCMGKKKLICTDCGKEFEASSKANRILRCKSCAKNRQLELQRKSMKEKRNVK